MLPPLIFPIKPATILRMPVSSSPPTTTKSPIKKSYEETKHVSSTSKDSEFGSTFNNAKSDSDGFESF